VGDASILADLAVEILAVNRLEWTPEQVKEWEVAPGKFDLLTLCRPHDEFLVRPFIATSETLRQSFPCPGSCDDKILFIE